MSEPQPPLVKVYDPETKVITLMPASELSAGMCRVKLSTLPDEVWVEAAKLKTTSVIRHPAFTGPLEQRIRYIEQSLREVYPQTYEQWEEGFRSDHYAEDEINDWVHLCRCLNDFIAMNLSPREERQQAFAVLAACLIGTPETALEICAQKLPDRQKAESLVRAFFSSAHPSS